MQNDWSDTLKTKLVLVCFAGEEKVLFGVILRGRGHIQASLEGTDRGLGTCTVLAGGTLSSFPGAKGLDWILFGLLFEDLEKNLAYLKCI